MQQFKNFSIYSIFTVLSKSNMNEFKVIFNSKFNFGTKHFFSILLSKFLDFFGKYKCNFDLAPS